jgi:hypothetical protein
MYCTGAARHNLGKIPLFPPLPKGDERGFSLRPSRPFDFAQDMLCGRHSKVRLRLCRLGSCDVFVIRVDRLAQFFALGKPQISRICLSYFSSSVTISHGSTLTSRFIRFAWLPSSEPG